MNNVFYAPVLRPRLSSFTTHTINTIHQVGRPHMPPCAWSTTPERTDRFELPTPPRTNGLGTNDLGGGCDRRRRSDCWCWCCSGEGQNGEDGEEDAHVSVGSLESLT